MTLNVLARPALVTGAVLLAISCGYESPTQPSIVAITPPPIETPAPAPAPVVRPLTMTMSAGREDLKAGQGVALCERAPVGAHDARHLHLGVWRRHSLQHHDGQFRRSHGPAPWRLRGDGRPGRRQWPHRARDDDRECGESSDAPQGNTTRAGASSARPRIDQVLLVCSPNEAGAQTPCNVTTRYGGSTLPSANVTQVDWDWGNGATIQTSGPTASRLYARAGSYTVFGVGFRDDDRWFENRNNIHCDRCALAGAAGCPARVHGVHDLLGTGSRHTDSLQRSGAVRQLAGAIQERRKCRLGLGRLRGNTDQRPDGNASGRQRGRLHRHCDGDRKYDRRFENRDDVDRDHRALVVSVFKQKGPRGVHLRVSVSEAHVQRQHATTDRGRCDRLRSRAETESAAPGRRHRRRARLAAFSGMGWCLLRVATRKTNWSGIDELNAVAFWNRLMDREAVSDAVLRPSVVGSNRAAGTARRLRRLDDRARHRRIHEEPLPLDTLRLVPCRADPRRQPDCP